MGKKITDAARIVQKIKNLHQHTARKGWCWCQKLEQQYKHYHNRRILEQQDKLCHNCHILKTAKYNAIDLELLEWPQLSAKREKDGNYLATRDYHMLLPRSLDPSQLFSTQSHTVSIDKNRIFNIVSIDRVIHALTHLPYSVPSTAHTMRYKTLSRTKSIIILHGLALNVLVL